MTDCLDQVSPVGMAYLWENFPDYPSWYEKIHPENGRQHSLAWGHGQYKNREGLLSTKNPCIHSLCVLDCGYDMISCLRLLPLCFSHSDTIIWNCEIKQTLSFCSWSGCFVKYNSPWATQGLTQGEEQALASQNQAPSSSCSSYQVNGMHIGRGLGPQLQGQTSQLCPAV